MSRRKGLSLEEKRSRMLDFFYETEEIFQLKNVEKRCSKEKGITPMAIKDVLQSLVDDNLVHCEKVGTSNYFWSFPSQATNVRKRQKASVDDDIVSAEQKREKLTKHLEEAMACREPSEERTHALEEIQRLRSKRDKLAADMASHASCDPRTIREKQAQTKVAHEAANRWTDNVFNIKSWCTKKFMVEPKVFDKQFGITEDFDYL